MSTIQQLGIGIFDSGIGGLTVLKALMRQLPQESFHYFADLAHVPYGNKPKELLMQYCKTNTHFLMEKGIKYLVVACHTASSLVMQDLKAETSIPIMDMIDATIQSLILQPKKDKIAILATRNTIASLCYQQLIKKLLPQSIIYPIACERFVPLIEQGQIDTSYMDQVVSDTLQSLFDQDIDVALLACTHFPFIHSSIQKALGPQIVLIDPAECLAHLVQAELKHKQLLSLGPPKMQLYTNESNPFFKAFSNALLEQDALL